uniref:Uncharacterized protein n=1 Tax=Panagrolaimus davidi TaxID=227884 RepID=A0A914P8T2_9BILA
MVDLNNAGNSTDERTENIKRLFRETYFKILATAPPATKSPTTSLKPKTTTTTTAEPITSTVAIKTTTTTTTTPPTTTVTTAKPTTKPPPTTTTLTTETPVGVYRASHIIMESRPPPRRIPLYTPVQQEMENVDYPETPYRGGDCEIQYGDENPEEIPSAHIPVEYDHYEICGNARQRS